MVYLGIKGKFLRKVLYHLNELLVYGATKASLVRIEIYGKVSSSLSDCHHPTEVHEPPGE